MSGKITILVGRKCAQVGRGVISLGIKILRMLIIPGIAFTTVSCDVIVTRFIPSKNTEFTIFQSWTYLFAVLFFILLFAIASIHAVDPSNKWPNRSTNYLVVILGASLGWLLGIVLEPFTSREAGKFVTYAGAISAFFTGYGAGKLDDLIKYIFNPQNLTRRRAFHGALFLVSFVIALIVVYESRFGVYEELSITTANPLPDAMANKAYGPIRIEVSGGTPPLKWDITPALPEGLSLDRNIGVISGTPKGGSRATNYRITVSDSAKPSLSSSKDLSLEVKTPGTQTPGALAPSPPPTPKREGRIPSDGQLAGGFKIRDPGNGPAPTNPVPKPQNQLEATLLDRQFDFAFNSAELPSDTGTLADLKAVAARLSKHRTSVLIEGHADGVGTSAYNVTLSQERAKTVRKLLVDKGVPPSLLHTYGYGQGCLWQPYIPAGPSNRRVRIVECAIEGLGDRCTIPNAPAATY